MRLFRRNSQPAIDLTEPTADDLETVRRIRANSPGGQITFGAPTRCPDCSSYGHVELVDARNTYTDNRCPACRAAWRISRRAVEATATNDDVVEPIGGGILIQGLSLTL